MSARHSFRTHCLVASPIRFSPRSGLVNLPPTSLWTSTGCHHLYRSTSNTPLILTLNSAFCMSVGLYDDRKLGIIIIIIIIRQPLCPVVGRRPQHAVSKRPCLMLSSAISCRSSICPGRLSIAWLVSLVVFSCHMVSNW